MFEKRVLAFEFKNKKIEFMHRTAGKVFFVAIIDDIIVNFSR